MRKTKLFVEVKSVTDLEGNRRSDPPYEGIYDYPGYVPLIEVGSVMMIMDCEMALTRLTTTKVQSYSFNEDTRTHIVRTKNSIYALQDYYNPKARKRAKAPLYMHSPIGRRFQEDNPDPDRHLLAYGRYRTKIYPADLPEWYVGGYMYKRRGFMSAKGVKYLLYKPNYVFNHLYKDDILFISYDKEITPIENDDGFKWYEGYDYCLSGVVILDFVDAAEKYSGVDVSGIREELVKKRAWYYETYKSGDE